MKKFISPSLLSADKNRLLEEIKTVEKYGAEYLHWDVMDGKFVPNTSYTVEQVQEYAHKHNMINDVHIMVVDPEIEAPLFAKAGADIVTFHIEAVDSLESAEKIIDQLHSLNCKAGISVKPNTAVEEIFPLLKKLDLALVMSVEPGKGGQKFMPIALEKIAKLRSFIDERSYKCLIEVDGGINGETGQECLKAGVDILVAGSYLFGHEDIKERMESLR